MEERRGVCRVSLVELRERDDLKDIDLKDNRWGVDCVDIAKDRDKWGAVVNAVMNLQVPYNGVVFLATLRPVSFAGRTLLHGVS
jgi:hypothetical protein